MKSSNSIQALGWHPFFESQIQSEERAWLCPARVTEEHKGAYRISDGRERLAEVSGRFRHQARSKADYPSVGDWVMVEDRPADGRATIHRLLERRSKISRRAAGAPSLEQLIAANVDTVFLLSSLNQDLNPKRIERYLTAAWDAGTRPVILLTKADLHPDPRSELERIRARIPHVEALVISSQRGDGLEEIARFAEAGQTVALLGSSGVGKSSLLNRMLGDAWAGDRAQVREIRESDDRGKHTTTHRQLWSLPSGALLIDTPGMRELQLWGAEENVDESFPEIAELARRCRFSDCGHKKEPGCAVRSAEIDGKIDADQISSYLKLEREAAFQRRKQDAFEAIEEKRRIKLRGREGTERMKAKRPW